MRPRSSAATSFASSSSRLKTGSLVYWAIPFPAGRPAFVRARRRGRSLPAVLGRCRAGLAFPHAFSDDYAPWPTLAQAAQQLDLAGRPITQTSRGGRRPPLECVFTVAVGVLLERTGPSPHAVAASDQAESEDHRQPQIKAGKGQLAALANGGREGSAQRLLGARESRPCPEDSVRARLRFRRSLGALDAGRSGRARSGRSPNGRGR